MERLMFSKAGILTLVSGLVVAVFTGVSKFMQKENFWVDLTLSKLMGENATDAILRFSDAPAFQDLFQYLLIGLPLSFFLIGLGALLLFISLFVKNY